MHRILQAASAPPSIWNQVLSSAVGCGRGRFIEIKLTDKQREELRSIREAAMLAW